MFSVFDSTSPFASTSLFGSQQQSVFGQNNNTASNRFAPSTTNPFGSQTGGSIFGVTRASSTSPSTPTFQNTASSFGGSMPAFCSPTPASGSGTPSFGGSAGQPLFRGFGATTTPQPSPFTPSSTPSITSTSPAFQLFSQTSSSPFTPSTTSFFPSTSKFDTPNSGYGNNSFNSTRFQNFEPCSSSSLFGQTNPSQQSQSGFSFPSFGQQQQPAISSGGFGVSSNSFGQKNAFGQLSTGNQSNTVAPQPAEVAMNPFATLPTMPQISNGHSGSASDRDSSFLRLLSQWEISHPKNDGARVVFCSDGEEAPSIPKAKADAEDLRALLIRLLEL
ncbi:hypothetical protein MKX03_011352, partial [Papaver bracteatum]